MHTKIMHLFIIKMFIVYTVLDAGKSCCLAEGIRIKCSYPDTLGYALPGSQCRAYYKCVGKSRFERMECSGHEIFDFNEQRCVSVTGHCQELGCRGKPNGIYQDKRHKCKRFYTCVSGNIISIDNCPAEQFYNGVKCIQDTANQCNSSSVELLNISSPATGICLGKADGHYLHENSCAEYVLCSGGQAVKKLKCPLGLGYNEKQQKCQPMSGLGYCMTHSTTTYEHLLNMAVGKEFCRNADTGQHTLPELGCAFYVDCAQAQVKNVKKCPLNHYFDAYTRSCKIENAKERRTCFDRGITQDCFNKPNGYFRDSNCKSYYYCRNGYKTEYHCPVNMLFDGEQCVSAATYKCPQYPEDELCQSRADGYHKEANDGCRTYHYCSRGHKITYLCEEGHTFNLNANKCEPESQIAFAPCKQNQMCRGKSDGYHTDLRSNCRKYMFCKNGETITQITCRNNNVFNGKECVLPSAYACPSLFRFKQLNCMPKQCATICKTDGFFPDLNSSCRDYYFCIGGKATKLSCAAGKLFDGELCVNEDKFSCPTICDDDTMAENKCELNDYIT